MHTHKTPALILTQLKAGVVHLEWRQEMVVQIRIEPLAACRLDRLPDEIDADAVFPPRARLARKRSGEGLLFARNDARQISRFVIARHVGLQHNNTETRW